MPSKAVFIIRLGETKY